MCCVKPKEQMNTNTIYIELLGPANLREISGKEHE